MPRLAVPMSAAVVAVATLLSAPSGAAEHHQLAQAPAQAQAQAPASLQQRKQQLELLTGEYEAAVQQFEASEAQLDREHAGITQRQAQLDKRRREYRQALSACQDVTCVDGLNGQRDSINAEQLLLNRDIDAYNARMERRESDAAKLDLMETHLDELRERVRQTESGSRP